MNILLNELLLGYKPRQLSDAQLQTQVQIVQALDDINQIRDEATKQISSDQVQQKRDFDKKRVSPAKYNVGDLVAIEKQITNTGARRKLLPRYSGPMIVRAVLANDRYRVTDLPGSMRSQKPYDNIIAVDQMKPWVSIRSLSDSDEVTSDSDGVMYYSDKN